MSSTNRETDNGLLPEDFLLLTAILRGNEWLRAVLCTLARRGLAFRIADPARAQAILHALTALPLYKGGQFLFDLLEWEDFMLDGPAPEIVPTTLDARALTRLAAMLDSIRAHLDGSVEAKPVADIQPIVSAAPSREGALPPLDASRYLYEDVVLGVLLSISPYVLAKSANPV